MATMARTSLFGLLAALPVLGVACSSNTSSSAPTGVTLTDTLGNVFTLSTTSGFYGLTANDPNLTALSCETAYDGAVDAFALVPDSQILRVHSVQIPPYGYISFSPAEPGHPIACATDADCGPTLFSPPFTCLYGLCQYISATTSMKTIDVIALCQADIPWPKTCPYVTNPSFAQRLTEIAAVCGSATNCSTVPADCRQPVPVTSAPDAAPVEAPVDAGAPAVDGGGIDGGI